MKVTLLAAGKLSGAYSELTKDYAKRITLPFSLRVVSGADARAEGKALLAALVPKAFVVLLDERGEDLTSRAFADKLALWQAQGLKDLVFVIGGADGVGEEIRRRCDYCLGLGRKTWPHKLVRVMFLEQLYRAQQINAGHPYHRD